MAQNEYRGNLAAKVFPFLSTQLGQTVIGGGIDSVNSFEEGGGGNLPQPYYMHNVMPTQQGYKSVDYKKVLNAAGISFDRVLSIRDPSLTRGQIGITAQGKVYLNTAGDVSWTDVSSAVAGWAGGSVSIAYASGNAYVCFSLFGVFKVDVVHKILIPVTLAGIVTTGIVAITSSANYLVLTDGAKIYWSSTISPEDFVPSLTTGAGSGVPTGVEAAIVALAPLGNGFVVYTAVNAVIATYTQNPKYPWTFKGAGNSKGVASDQHITYGGDDGVSYAWTSAGLQRINAVGAELYLPEVTDFLAGKQFEDWDNASNSILETFSPYPFQIKLSFIGGRFLVISYGLITLTHALVFDTAIKRWGKLKIQHAATFEFNINTDSYSPTNKSASAKRTLGIVQDDGTTLVCDFDNNTEAKDSVLVIGKLRLIRSRLVTLDKITLESIGVNNRFTLTVLTTMDGKTVSTVTDPIEIYRSDFIRQYAKRITGVNHSLVLKGTFNLNSYLVSLHNNGKR